jgi:ABC-type dipeptide/oligopeptide/nickel transport systems, permease components
MAEKNMDNNNFISQIASTGKRKTAFEEFWRRYRKNKLAVAGLLIVVLYILMAIFADVFFSYDFITQNQISNAFAEPFTSAEIEYKDNFTNHFYVLGADNFGRDILGRIIHGARISMIIGFSTIAFVMRCRLRTWSDRWVLRRQG